MRSRTLNSSLFSVIRWNRHLFLLCEATRGMNGAFELIAPHQVEKGAAVGLTRKGKGTKLQIIVDAKGLPLGLSMDSASTGETAMVQQTLAFS